MKNVLALRLPALISLSILVTLATVHYSAERAEAQRFACKECTPARKRYVNNAINKLCKDPGGLLAKINKLQNRITKFEGKIERIKKLMDKYDCDFIYQGNFDICESLAYKIMDNLQIIDQIKAKLSNIATFVKNDCDVSRKKEKKKKCAITEAEKYCDAVDAVFSKVPPATLDEKLKVVKDAISDRCDDLKGEYKDWANNCPNCPQPVAVAGLLSWYVASKDVNINAPGQCPVNPTQPTPSPEQTPIPDPETTVTPTPTETPSGNGSSCKGITNNHEYRQNYEDRTQTCYVHNSSRVHLCCEKVTEP